MIKTIQLPLVEYQRLQTELNLLKNNELLATVNQLIDLLFQDKYGLYMGNFTEDLTEHTINNAWNNQTTVWDNV